MRCPTKLDFWKCVLGTKDRDDIGSWISCLKDTLSSMLLINLRQEIN